MDSDNLSQDPVKEVQIPRPNLVYRTSWGADPPKDEVLLNLPVKDVLFTFTGGRECHSQRDCMRVLRQLQRRDMVQRGMPDIQPNFLVGGDCVVYEGRGWHVNATKDDIHLALDGKSIDISFIGNFKHKYPTDKVISAGASILKYLVEQGFVTEEFQMTPLGLMQDIIDEEDEIAKNIAEEVKQREKMENGKRVFYYDMVKNNQEY